MFCGKAKLSLESFTEYYSNIKIGVRSNERKFEDKLYDVSSCVAVSDGTRCADKRLVYPDRRM